MIRIKRKSKISMINKIKGYFPNPHNINFYEVLTKQVNDEFIKKLVDRSIRTSTKKKMLEKAARDIGKLVIANPSSKVDINKKLAPQPKSPTR